MRDNRTDKAIADNVTDKIAPDRRAHDEATTDRPNGDRPSGDAPASGPFPLGSGPLPPARLWVGFLELEAWLAAVDPARPVLLLPVIQPVGQDGPFRTERLLVCCQQVTAEGHVLYCHLAASTLTRVCGAVVDADWRQRATAWESLWECAEETLAERGLAVLAATASCPPEWALLLGHAGGIAYDEVNRRFRRVRPA